ncbi:hypothetical protein FRC19_003141 [Serendipita sp. 401]|nr:hypothetical protein FRC19_003141 [Serendipita sp. 401]
MATDIAPRDKLKKKKKKSKRSEEMHVAEETEPTQSTYVPPEGFKLLASGSDYGVFDWDTFERNPNLELWAIRMPSGLKPKYLNNMSFPLPSSTTSEGAELARITAGKRQTQYSISPVSSSTGGEELKNVLCLLPKASRDGKLYPASRPISGHLIVSEVQPTILPEPGSLQVHRDIEQLPLPSSKRYSYPEGLLKHKYVPTAVPIEEMDMQSMPDESQIRVDSPQIRTTALRAAEIPESPTKRSKKRKKDEEEAEKKVKKVKAK